MCNLSRYQTLPNVQEYVSVFQEQSYERQNTLAPCLWISSWILSFNSLIIRLIKGI